MGDDRWVVFVQLPLFGELISNRIGNSLLLCGKTALELNVIYIFCRVVVQHIIKIEGVSALLNGSQSSEGGHHFVLNSPVLHLQHFNSSALAWQHKRRISNATLHANPTFQWVWISAKWKTVNIWAALLWPLASGILRHVASPSELVKKTTVMVLAQTSKLALIIGYPLTTAMPLCACRLPASRLCSATDGSCHSRKWLIGTKLPS